jgi:DNA gyrase subunit B
MTSATTNTYNADSIQALTGLAHVRHRPLMYLGSAGLGSVGLHHLIWEIVDNSVDEAMAGHGDRVIITLHPDGSVGVQDFGRGIPVDLMKDGVHKGRSALEVVLTETNAGGKFDSDSYKVSGGLHGVGASVVTGLSTRLDAEVWRGGRRHQIGFKLAKSKKGELTPGVPDGEIREVGPAPRSQTTGRTATGTIITFWPDLALFRDDQGDSFTKPQWSTRLIAERLRHKSFVHPGLTFELRDNRDKANKTINEWCSKGGVADLVAELTAEADTISPVLAFNGIAEEKTKNETTLHAAIVWTVEGRDTTLGYANGVANPEGGTHINGFRAAITEAIQNFITSRTLLKDKEDMPTTKDIFAGAVAVVSIMIPSPAFAGNSKGKLMNPEATGRTRAVVLPQMAKWLEENPGEAKRVADGAIAVMRARTKSNADQLAAKALLAKGSKSRGGLPAKLRDCTRKTERATELLLVEGDSAGGTAIDARDPSFQAILPLRGKPLNSYSETLDRVVKSGTLADLILTLGCGIGDDYDLDKLRYQHVMVVADADKDGQHIRTLLTVFFYRWMPGLIESGRMLYAMPPLWSTVLRGEHIYLADDNALAEFRAANPSHKGHVGRMKGLGEMDHRELRMVIGAGRTVGRVMVSDPITLAQLAEKLFGPKSEGRKEWFLERTGHSLSIQDDGHRKAASEPVLELTDGD